MTADDQGLLTVKEAAERLGQQEANVRRLLREGSLRGVRAGTGPRAAWRIPVAEVEWQLKLRVAQERERRRLEAAARGGYGPAGVEAIVTAAARHQGLTEQDVGTELDEPRRAE